MPSLANKKNGMKKNSVVCEKSHSIAQAHLVAFNILVVATTSETTGAADVASQPTQWPDWKSATYRYTSWCKHFTFDWPTKAELSIWRGPFGRVDVGAGWVATKP